MVSWVFMAKPVVATSAEIDAGMQVIIDSVPGIEPTKARDMARAVLEAAGRVRQESIPAYKLTEGRAQS